MRRLFFALMAALLIAGCSKSDVAPELKDNVNFAPLRAGSPATDFQYNDMQGKPFRLSEQRGKTVLVYFWRMKCKECMDPMDSLEALQKKYRDRGLIVVAVGADNMHSSPRRDVEAYLEKHAFSFVNIRDDIGMVSGAFDVLKAPEAYLIDKNGKIAAIISGPVDWMSPENAKLIEPIL